MMTRRTKARCQAHAILAVDFSNRDGSLLRVCEILDETPEFNSLSFRSVLGAVRSAARRLNRLDKDDDQRFTA